VVGASGVLIGLICAFWMRRRVIQSMEPMQELSQQVQHYDPMRPGSGLPPSSRQEFVDIRQAIVDLGGRLAKRAESEQAFAAHAAHALRTPLAGMEAQLAVAMKEIPDPVRPRLERTREAVVRLKRVVTSMLALFRSHAELEPQTVNVAELLARLPVDHLSVRIEDACMVRADPNLLAAALMNLMDNAVRYRAHTCWVTCRSEGASQSVTVRDDGPGLPPERCASLQASLDEPIEDGFFGLGLKLAALVARAHKGRLVIDGGGPARRGFSATLVLWADAAET
jgi:signal transduction histidine kinase